MDIAIITVTKNGDEIASLIKKHFEVHIFSKFKDSNFNFKCVVKKAMENYTKVIFITSTGIAVRGIVPYIKSKDVDPAVIVIDNSCRFVISLLSGHIGGANEFTEIISKVLKAVPVITTATDNISVIAPDIIAKKNDLVIDSLKDAKKIAALLVNKDKVYFKDDRQKISLPKGYTKESKNSRGYVFVSNKQNIDCNAEGKEFLRLIRKDVVLGIGCRKNFPENTMRETVLRVLKEYNIDYRAVKSIGTVEVKKDEKAIKELSKFLKCKLKIFTIDEIKNIQHRYKGSDFVEKTIGIRAVCEPCVELQRGRLITCKLKLDKMTLSIGILDC